MSDIISKAVEDLSSRISEDQFDDVVKIEIEDEGAIIIDAGGVRAGEMDEDADCTMRANAETFVGMLDGSVNPTGAFMGGKLKVDGDMSIAMKLGAILS